MSTIRYLKIPRGQHDPSRLPRGSNGRALCRWCATETTPPRRTFCSDACVHEWKLRSNAQYAKRFVFERDHGICETCGVDTCASLKGPVVRRHNRFPIGAACSRFDMDHRIPVVLGGGSCGLENLRTLCRACHRLETARLAARRAAERRAAKSK